MTTTECAAEGCTFIALKEHDLCAVHRRKARLAEAKERGAVVATGPKPPARFNGSELLRGNFWMALAFAGVFGALPGYFLWTPLAYITAPAFMVLTAYAMLVNPLPKTRCPDCRKRVKSGAVRCSKCGTLFR